MSHAKYRAYWGLVAFGVLAVVLYYILRANSVGGIGQPTDIGGGLIALVGYMSILIGVLLMAIRYRRRNRRLD